MQSPLETRISALRGKVRRRLALQGLCWVVFTLILAFLAVSWLDWFFPLAREVRLALLVVSAALVSWVVWRTVLVPLVARFDDLDIALKIEQRWPGLNDRLSSTVEFLRAGEDGETGSEDRHGSKVLREATIAQTLKEVESIDFREALDPRPMRLAGSLSLWASACLALITVAAPDFQRLALQRLMLGSQEWPRQTYLEVTEAPVKVARGDPFRMTVAAEVGKELPVIPPRIWFQTMAYAIPPLRLLEDSLNGRSPTSAKVYYRFSDGETATESLRPDDQGVFHGRLESVSRPFRFYVAAGDDATAWRQVAVVPPPSLTDVEIQLKAPAYTKPYLAENEQDALIETLAPGLSQARVVEGTEIRFNAPTNKPIVEASLYQDDEKTEHEIQISRQGRQLSTAFSLFGSASYWFSLLDDEGFRNREAVRYEIRTVADATPRVVIEEPLNDRFIRANADVPIRVSVDDDYGVQLIRLVYTVAMADSEPGEEKVIPIWASEAEIDGGTARRQTVEYKWDLSTLNLQPGALVTLFADARDFYSSPDGSEGPNLGKSRSIRLRVIEDDEFRRLLDDRRREIREAVERTLEIQKQARTPVREARNTLEKTDQLPDRERERLEQAATNQQQVTNQISGRTDGIDQKIRSFLDELRDSKLDSADGEDQMREMLEAVERIQNENLNPAEQGLARATKALEGQPAGPDDQARDRDQAQQAQAEGDDPAGQQAPPQDQQPGDQQAQTKGGQQPQPQDGQPQPPQQGEGQQSQPPQGVQPQEPDGQQQQPQGQGGPQEAKQSLAEADENQQAIAEELEQMLAGLEQFETLKGVTQDAEKLLDRQEQALQDSEEAVDDPDMTGKDRDDLNPQQRADLENLAERQREVAQELQDLEARMNEMARRIEETDPLAAAALREAVEEMRERGTSARMGESADQLQENQMGEARENQQQSKEDLQDLVDNLKNRKENDLARLIQELKDSQQQIQELQEQQLANLEKTKAAQQIADEQERKEELQQLAKEQERLQEELKKQLQKLQKLRADAAAQAGQRAEGRMADAQQNLDDDDAEAAAQNEEEALNDLKDVQDEIADAIQNAEEQLAMEQFLKMRDNLRILGERQEKLLEETVGYDQKRQEAEGRLTRAESFDVRGLARVQTGVRDETQVLVSRLDGAPVFKLTLERAVADMETAARRLQRIETGDETQRAERNASKRFQQLIEALRADQANQQGGQQQEGQQGGEGGQGGGGDDGIPTEAELKVLKALQEEINERTEHYEELRRRNQDLDEDQEIELVRLEEDQGTIADLLRDIVQPKRSDGLED